MSKIKLPDRKKRIHILKDIVYLAIASFVLSYGVVAVMLPYGLTTGGLTGIVRILQAFTGFEYSVLYYIVAIIILTLSYIFLGKTQVKKMLLLFFVYSPILWLVEKWNPRFTSSHDPILAVVFSGVFLGISCGIVLLRGSGFPGTDALSKILQKKLLPQMKLSDIILLLDGIIIVISAFVYDVNIALYALITQMVFVKTLEFIMYGLQEKVVQVEIISKRENDIKAYIINELRRGVSTIKVKGEYTEKKYDKVVTLCSMKESLNLKNYIAEIDKNAFVTIKRVEYVWGKGPGFSKIDESI